MRKTKTFERKVWVCDDCANELELNLLAKCDKCGLELCHKCAVRFCVGLTKWDDGRGTISHLVYSSEKEGVHGTFCKQCYNKLEGTLLTFGFKHFKSSVVAL